MQAADTAVTRTGEALRGFETTGYRPPDERDLEALFRRHFGDPSDHGWRVRMRARFGYHSPDQWYEAVVDRLVTPGCRWLDVGGGKSVFPENPSLARELAGRCALLVGVDPSDNIDENSFVHRQVRSAIEDFRSDVAFDLATFRMVAEHIEHPARVIAALDRLIEPGGHVVIYTPNRWSPSAIAASMVPSRWHSIFTGLFAGMSARDTFPTFYRMNTRGELRDLFGKGNFDEAGFAWLDNCRTLQRVRVGCAAELAAWRALRAVGFRYPENDLLGVYRKR